MSSKNSHQSVIHQQSITKSEAKITSYSINDWLRNKSYQYASISRAKSIIVQRLGTFSIYWYHMLVWIILYELSFKSQHHISLNITLFEAIADVADKIHFLTCANRVGYNKHDWLYHYIGYVLFLSDGLFSHIRIWIFRVLLYVGATTHQDKVAE